MNLTPEQNNQFIDRAYALAKVAAEKLLSDQRVDVGHRHLQHIDAQALVEGWQDSIDQYLTDLENVTHEWHTLHATDPQRAEQALEKAKKLASDLVTNDIFPHARLHPRHHPEQPAPNVLLAEYRVVAFALLDDLEKLLQEILRIVNT